MSTLITPKFVITDVGLAAAALAHPEGPFIHITKITVGSAFGYTPQRTDVGLNGNLLYEGVPTSYSNIGDNTRNIIFRLPPDAGPFEFGEIGLWLESGELFAKAAFEKAQLKLSSLGTNLLATYTFNCLIQLEQTASVIKIDTSEAPPTFLEVDLWSDVYPPGLSADPSVQIMLVKELDNNGNSSLIHQADPTQWTVGTNYHFVATASITSATTDSVTVSSVGLDANLLSNENRQYVIETTEGYLRSALSFQADGGGYKFMLNPEPLPSAPVGTIKIHSNVPTGGGGGGGGTVGGMYASLSSNSVTLPADVDGVVAPSSYAAAQVTIVIIDGTTDVTAGYTISKADSAGLTSTLTGNTVNVTHLDDNVDVGAVTFTATKAGSPTFTKTYNVLKLKAGSGTGGAQSASLTKYSFFLLADATGHVLNYNNASTTLTILDGSIDDTANWTITKTDSAGLTSTLVGGVVTITNLADATDTGTVSLHATKIGKSDVNLVFSVAKLRAGTAEAGTTITLTKEQWIFPADSAGNVVSYMSAETEIRVYNGTQDETANWVLSKVDSAGVTSTLTPYNAGTIPVTYPKIVVTAFAQPQDAGAVSITATRAGFPNAVKDFGLVKAKAGTPGTGGGTRGSMTFYVPNRTSWSDAVATSTASVFGGPIVNDAVHQYDFATSFSQFKVWNGTVWNTVTPLIDAANILNGTIAGTKFASSISPVGIVSSLPNPVGYTGPKVVFLTTDGKLYRYTGSAFTAEVPAVNITGQLTDAQIASISAAKLTSQITATQIADGAISTPKLSAGAVTAANIAADAITADKIAANAITASELSAGAVTASKIQAGAVTASAIAADAITAGQIAAGAIGASEIAAGAITAAAIAANAITGDKIAANTITAGDIMTGTITAASGVLANAAVGTLQIGGNAVTVASSFQQNSIIEISSASNYTNVCTGTVQLSGFQPLLIIGSAGISGQRIGSPSNYDLYYQGQYWKFNSGFSGGDFRYLVFNGSSYDAFIGATIIGAATFGIPVIALLPVLPAGTYTIWMQAIKGTPAVPGSGNSIENYTVRDCRMIFLETKR